ncbi:hypothetical protein BKI52_03340 [marine bacterium AO1-C]|nr:hypothetical protein BKI52_03340 [marine bacterium AO1-C]
MSKLEEKQAHIKIHQITLIYPYRMSKDKNEFNNRSNSDTPRSNSFAAGVLGLNLLSKEELIELLGDDEELMLENDLEL